jgi:hypothetical protein
VIGSMDHPLHLGPSGVGPGGDVQTAIRQAKVVLDYLRGFRRTIQAVSFDFNGTVVEVRETDRVEWVLDRYRAQQQASYFPRHRADVG